MRKASDAGKTGMNESIKLVFDKMSESESQTRGILCHRYFGGRAKATLSSSA